MEPLWDETETTTCYMCACRCGIRVHKKNGKPVYIDGNRAHPVNGGVLCAKGAAGLKNHYSPARLTTPMRRVGPRGSNRFEPISWEQAMDIAIKWLKPIRDNDPKRLAFYTGRDQSQAFTGWWAAQFGTPNYAAHGGFCSVNMAAAGLYTTGGSFWEFGEPDWDRTRYLLLFGVAEDHASNPLKVGLGKLKTRGAKVLSINPVRTGYSAIADEWIPIRPGTDGAFVMALCHELLTRGWVDTAYLKRFTNAGHLVISDPGSPRNGLLARDANGSPLVCVRQTGAVVPFERVDDDIALKGAVTLADGTRAVPAFELLARRVLEDRHDPGNAAQITGVPASDIRRIAREISKAAFESDITVEEPWIDSWGRHYRNMVGRPVSMHAMRGISAHRNGFHTCRIIHILQLLLGTVDTPGGHRYRPPFPRHIPCPTRPSGKPEQINVCEALPGMPLGFPGGPEDLLVEEDGTPVRIDKAFSWEAPLAIHGLMQNVITNAWKGDPYKIDTLFMFMANMAWNSSMNTSAIMKMLTDHEPGSDDYRIPHIIYVDAYQSEMVAYADLVLPDTTYLERWDCISLLDRPISDPDAPADAIRAPVVEPDRNVRPFQDVLLDLGHRLEFTGLTNADGSPRYPGGYADYIVNHERKPGVGSLAGWRGADGESAGKGAVNPHQLDAYRAHDCHWRHELAAGHRFYKFANAGYLEDATSLGLIDHSAPIVLQLYSEELQKFRLAAEGHGLHQPPEELREQVREYLDPLPLWYPVSEPDEVGFPLHAVTQRPMAMYHAWGSQNAWLRQIHGYNRLFISQEVARQQDISDGDWVIVESQCGRIRVQAAVVDGVQSDTVWTWNAIGKRAGAWTLGADAKEATTGFLLNHLIDDQLSVDDNGRRRANGDPVTGQAAWYDLRVRITRCTRHSDRAEPHFDVLATNMPVAGITP